MHILRADTYRTMPWKNGGGSTTEIAVAPEGAGLDDFDWRISMATVAADGPFSSFPGVDRTLSILEGAGLVLHGLGAEPVRLDRAAEPFDFPADAAVSATLIDGPILDLNVMTRRGRLRGRTRRLTGAGEITVDGGGADVLFLLAERPCRVTAGNGEPVELGRRDAARLDGPVPPVTVAGEGRIELYEIRLTVV